MPTRRYPAPSALPSEATHAAEAPETGPISAPPDEAWGRRSRDAAGATGKLNDESLVGCRIDRYEIVRVIGRGGMGTVYEAVNTVIGKRVAMKFLDGHASRQKEAVARFQREARAASAVESPHIVEIFDAGTSDSGVPFIVMELLRGEDLGYRIRRCGRLELDEALSVTAHILRGLRCAHAVGIIHRDLKPDNIFLVERGDDPCFAKLLDFGISKVRRSGSAPISTLTRKGTVLGTPFYMSPEQAQAQPDVDGRADLWSVGAILYEALTGRPPYVGTTYEQVIVSICMNDAPDVRRDNPAVPQAVAEVIATALERDRNDRFADAEVFLQALKGASGRLILSHPAPVASQDVAQPWGSSFPWPSSGKTVPKPGSGLVPVGALDKTLEAGPTPLRPLGNARLGRRAGAHRGWRLNERRPGYAFVAIVALVAGGLGTLFSRRGPGQAPRVDVGPWASVSSSGAPTPVVVSAGEPPPRSSSMDGPSPVASAAPPVAAPSESSERRVETPKPVRNPGVSSRGKSASSAANADRPLGVAPGLHLKTD